MKYFFCGLLFLPVSTDAQTMTGKVEKMEFGPKYRGIVALGIEGNNDTVCADNPNGFDYAFDASTEGGKLMFSALLAAQSSNQEVTISGEGTCSLISTVEDVEWMQTR